MSDGRTASTDPVRTVEFPADNALLQQMLLAPSSVYVGQNAGQPVFVVLSWTALQMLLHRHPKVPPASEN
jgi:hypothetical protein